MLNCFVKIKEEYRFDEIYKMKLVKKKRLLKKIPWNEPYKNDLQTKVSDMYTLVDS